MNTPIKERTVQHIWAGDIIKRWSAIFLLLSILLGSVLWSFYYINARASNKIIDALEPKVVELQRQAIVHNLKLITSDVMILSQSAILRKILDGDNGYKDELSKGYLTFSEVKRSFDQVRYFDNTGMEIVRVNFNEGNPANVPEVELQSKGKRYYFADAFALERGEIFVSPLDLNIERGVIERPAKEKIHPGDPTFSDIWRLAKGKEYVKPVIRFGTPVFDSLGQKKGIVLVNYFGTQLINIFDEIARNSLGQCFLINREGFFLKGPSPEAEWGFMREHDIEQKYDNTFPKGWERISREESGQFYSDKGLMTFTTVYPFDEYLKASTGSGKVLEVSNKRLKAKDYAWKIVSFVPIEVFNFRAKSILQEFFFLYIVLVILLAGGSFFWAHASKRSKQVKEELKKLSVATQQSPVSIVITNTEGNVEYANPMFYKLTGYSEEEILGKNMRILQSGTMPKETYEQLWGAISAGKEWRGELHNKKKNGELYWENAVISAIVNKNREITNFLAVKEDITELKKAAEEIKSLSKFPSENPNPVLRVAKNGRVLYSNDAGFEVLKKWKTKIGESIPESWQRLIAQAFETKANIINEEKLESKIFSFVISPIIDFGYANLYARDITKRKKTEEKLHASEERFRLSVLESPFPTMIHADDGEVIQINKIWTELTGYTPEEIPTLSDWTERAYRERKEIVKSRINKIFKYDEKVVEGEYSITSKNGKTLIWDFSSAPLGRLADGRRVVISMAMDVTERKKAKEDLLQAKQEAEAASLSKSQFLANVSHEIRTPLNSIIGFSEIISRSSDQDEMRRQAGTILAETEILLQLINDLLDDSKMDAGKMELDIISFDFEQLIASVSSYARLIARKKQLEWRVSVSDDVPQYLRGDQLRLRQIILNLVNNAFKFTEKGSVELSVEVLKKDSQSARLRFLVKDTGIGIPKEKQKFIFESFTQADGSIARRFGGTGLGTNIAKDLVELMEGEIGLNSDYGKGSTFWFTLSLPVLSREEGKNFQAAHADFAKRINQGGARITGRILVVEDYESNQEVARKHLENAGHIVEIASNGKEALAACEKKAYDLILMDMQMPEMDGCEVTRRIRGGVSRNTNKPILGSTANVSVTARQACLDSGMDDVIIKPFRVDPFLETVDKCLRQSKKKRKAKAVPGAVKKTASPGRKEVIPIDYERVLHLFSGDRDFLDRLIHKFIKAAKAQIDLIKKALRGNDAETMRREAHKIKSGAGNIAAMPLTGAVACLEELIRSGRVDEFAKQVHKVEEEFVLLERFVSEGKK